MSRLSRRWILRTSWWQAGDRRSLSPGARPRGVGATAASGCPRSEVSTCPGPSQAPRSLKRSWRSSRSQRSMSWSSTGAWLQHPETERHPRGRQEDRRALGRVRERRVRPGPRVNLNNEVPSSIPMTTSFKEGHRPGTRPAELPDHVRPNVDQELDRLLSDRRLIARRWWSLVTP